MPGMLVSVYIPTYNRLALLQRAVASVQAQTHRDLEILIVDDCSSDGTQAWLGELARQDPRVRCLTKPANSGACISRNMAIQEARGEFVTGLDDDDEFTPERIARFVQAWQSHTAAGTTPSCLYTDITITTASGWQSRVHKPAHIDLPDMFIGNRAGPQVFSAKAHFIGAGLFDPAFPAWQDYDCWFRLIARYGTARKVPGPATYRVDESHASPRISVSGRQKIHDAFELFCRKHAALLGEDGTRAVRLCYFKSPEIRMTPADIGWFFRHGCYLRPLVVYLKKIIRPWVYGR